MSDQEDTIPARPESYRSQAEKPDPEAFQDGVEMNEDAPAEVGEEQSLSPDGESRTSSDRRSSRWGLMVIAGVLAIVLVALLSGWSGYNAGIDLRKEAQATQDASAIETQYDLALQEIEQGQYFRARQRLEYIIEHNPSYPGVTDKLAEVLLLLNATATPTIVPTATITPTPDTSQIEEIERLYNQAQQQLANDEWNNAIETLLLMRKIDSGYEMVAVDGMLFIALRNRGIQKISIDGELEEGLYDLGLAAKFGPLDTEAEGYLTWAKLYVTGASFWELDWSQVIFYFSQVAPQYPSLRDGSGWTAKERYRLALFNFGNTLLGEGDPCQAAEQYELSLSLGYDAQVEEALNQANKECGRGDGDDNSSDESSDQPPVVAPTNPTPTTGPTQVEPTQPPPTETPAPTPTEEPTPSP